MIILRCSTRKKQIKKGPKSGKIHPKLDISSHIHTRYGHNMASYGLFTYASVIYHLYQPYPASYGLKWLSDSCKYRVFRWKSALLTTSKHHYKAIFWPRIISNRLISPLICNFYRKNFEFLQIWIIKVVKVDIVVILVYWIWF